MSEHDLVPVAHAAQGFSGEQLDLIKRTICAGATNDELQLFIAICNRTGLDPFSKQIYAIQRWDNRLGRNKMVIQTGIDGYRAIADRQGNYAGSDDPLFDDGLTEYQCRAAGKAHPETATVTVYKLVGGVRCPFTATASWASYFPGEKQGQMWMKMPYLMLAKCAEGLALRKGWAAQLSGVYTDAEMQQSQGEYIEAEAVTPPRDMTVSRVKHRSADDFDTSVPPPEQPAVVAEWVVHQAEIRKGSQTGAEKLFCNISPKKGGEVLWAVYNGAKIKSGFTGEIMARVKQVKADLWIIEHIEAVMPPLDAGAKYADEAELIGYQGEMER